MTHKSVTGHHFITNDIQWRSIS